MSSRPDNSSAPERRSTTWTLHQSDGHDFEFRLVRGASVTIGRDSEAGVSVLDAGISRIHARLRLEKDGLWVEDLGSQNGTFLNTDRITEAKVSSGDVLLLGRVSFVLTESSTNLEDTGPFEPLTHLPKEALRELLEAAHSLALAPCSAAARVLELAQRAVRYKCGGLLLWDNERNLLYPLASFPEAYFHEQSPPLAPTLVRAILDNDGVHVLEGRTAIATRLRAPSAPAGILYLEGFSQDDIGADALNYLAALAWLAAPSLGALGHTRSTDRPAPWVGATVTLEPEALRTTCLRTTCLRTT